MTLVKVFETVDPDLLKELVEISKSDGWYPVDEDWFKKVLSGDVVVFVAFENGDPVGFAVVNRWFKYEKYGVELDVISVKKEHHGRGLGTSLMRNVFEYVKRWRARLLFIFLFLLETPERSGSTQSLALRFAVCSVTGTAWESTVW